MPTSRRRRRADKLAKPACVRALASPPDNSGLNRAHSGLGSVGDPQFGDYVLDVDLDGAAADHEVPGDLGVRLALAQEGEDLDLPGREGLYAVGLVPLPGALRSFARCFGGGDFLVGTRANRVRPGRDLRRTILVVSAFL